MEVTYNVQKLMDKFIYIFCDRPDPYHLIFAIDSIMSIEMYKCDVVDDNWNINILFRDNKSSKALWIQDKQKAMSLITAIVGLM